MKGELSWKARRLGNTYCSPACGMRCTFKAYQTAKSMAQELATKMGKGWTTRVWENLGWHWSAISPCGRVKIHPYFHQGKVTGYSAFLGEKDSGGGLWVGDSRSPRRAVEKAVELGRQQLAYINSIVEGL